MSVDSARVPSGEAAATAVRPAAPGGGTGRPGRREGRGPASGAAPQGPAKWLPILGWLPGYGREALTSDLLAGLIVAVMLVPQGMAYAMLAGLPPQVGLYASIAPLLAYAVFGTSRSLAVGPVAIVSLMVASALAGLAAPGSQEQLALALSLSALVGGLMLLMGLLRLGRLVTFMSHPVISGFTSAAALIIGLSQVKHLLGLSLPRTESAAEQLAALWAARGEINVTTLAIGLGALVFLALAAGPAAGWLAARGMPDARASRLTKAAPLVAVVVTTLLVAGLGLAQAAGVAVVGEIPRGLPPLSLPGLDPELLRELLPAALAIAFVGYLESVAVAKALAARHRERIRPSQELIGLGAANLAASVTGGYPVTGGFSRSVVNDDAGARTGMAAVITAGLIALTVLWLTPLFQDLPKAVLAAIVLVAVAKLVDLRTLRETWRFHRADAFALMVTFLATLGLGVEIGVLVGVGTALALQAWRGSLPHIAVLGRLPGTETYRNVKRHEVLTDPRLLLLRVDESLHFSNAAYLETWLLNALAERPDVEEVVLVGSAINDIDASALESLETLNDELASAGARLSLAAIKGPVMDRLRRVDFLAHLSGGVYESVEDAVRDLAAPDSPIRARTGGWR